MSWRLVEGVPLPDAVGGHPALDFCNTRAGWGTETPKEYLRTAGVLALWARENGLVRTHADPLGIGPDVYVLARALALRDALYRCALHAGQPADWELVARESALARESAQLRPGAAGAPAAWGRRPGVSPALAALAAVAIAAEDLLTSSLSAVVAACPGEGCGWLFADRRGRRRWCSMAACGNRAKARRYAQRHGSEA